MQLLELEAVGPHWKLASLVRLGFQLVDRLLENLARALLRRY